MTSHVTGGLTGTSPQEPQPPGRDLDLKLARVLEQDLAVGVDGERGVAADADAAGRAHVDAALAHVGAADRLREEAEDLQPAQAVADADVEQTVVDARGGADPEAAAVAPAVPHRHQGE